MEKVWTKLNKVETLLRYLHMVGSVEIEGRCYKMTEDFHIYILLYNPNEEIFEDDVNKIIGLPDMPLAYFANLADKLSDKNMLNLLINIIVTNNRNENR